MNNSIDLSNLPRTVDGKIDWRKCNNEKVDFVYRGIEDSFILIKNIDMHKVLVGYNNQNIIMDKESIKRSCLGKLFGFAVSENYKYEIGQMLNNVKVVARTRVKGARDTVKGYEMICTICNYKYQVSEINLDRGDRCPLCSSHRIVRGINDLWTLRPDIAKYLKNKEDGYKYTVNSNKRVEFICPQCGNEVGLKLISDVVKRGISCKACGDGISFPNKFMYNLLTKLKECFQTEVVFDWCKFRSFDSNGYNFGIYDFVIPKRKLIIEMDGGLGHGKIIHNGSLISSEESLYRDIQKNKLAIENGYNIIRVDCDYYGDSNFIRKCKNAVINTLSSVFDFSNIDWNEIAIMSLKSNIVKTAELFIDGYTVEEIADEIKMSQFTIKNYLHRANDIKLFDYIRRKENV